MPCHNAPSDVVPPSSRRTFYEWRAKGRAPKCIRLPNGGLRIRRSEYQRWLDAREEVA